MEKLVTKICCTSCLLRSCRINRKLFQADPTRFSIITLDFFSDSSIPMEPVLKFSIIRKLWTGYLPVKLREINSWLGVIVCKRVNRFSLTVEGKVLQFLYRRINDSLELKSILLTRVRRISEEKFTRIYEENCGFRKIPTKLEQLHSRFISFDFEKFFFDLDDFLTRPGRLRRRRKKSRD